MGYPWSETVEGKIRFSFSLPAFSMAGRERKFYLSPVSFFVRVLCCKKYDTTWEIILNNNRTFIYVFLLIWWTFEFSFHDMYIYLSFHYFYVICQSLYLIWKSFLIIPIKIPIKFIESKLSISIININLKIRIKELFCWNLRPHPHHIDMSIEFRVSEYLRRVNNFHCLKVGWKYNMDGVGCGLNGSVDASRLTTS